MSYLNEQNCEEELIANGLIQLFQTLWNSSNDNMFILRREPSGEYVNEKSNPALERTFHAKEAQLDNANLKEVLGDVRIYEKIASRYDECIEKNLPITYEESHEIENGEKRFWLTTILPVAYKEENITKILGISREVTSIRNAEIALQKHNELLENEVERRTLELKNALAEMENLAVTDKLTKLYNRHKTDKVLSDEVNRSKRYDNSFGVVLLDIDDFKRINDVYGHSTGDITIKEFSTILSKAARESDTVGRWGGEEFLIIIPESNKESILRFAQRLKESIQSHKFKEIGHITASMGATLYRENDTVESLIKRVDKGLYKSKNSGKNLVSFE